MRDRIAAILDWLMRILTQPREELSRWQRLLRNGYDVGVFGIRQLRQDRAAQMAAALSFRTLFSLLPIFVVGTILVRAFRGLDQFRESLRTVLRSIGLDDVQIMGADSADPVSMTDWLIGLLEKTEQVNITAVGWVGVAVLIYSAISLMATIENSFNTIYRAPEGRSWMWRVPLYWFVLTLGPGAMIATVWLNARVSGWIDDVEGYQTLVSIAVMVWSFTVTWIVIFTFYMLVPNVSVQARSALIGGFVGTLLVSIGRTTMGAYLENAFSLKQLYGSLGFIPLAMFWVYIMWVAILFGLEVSAILQRFPGARALRGMTDRQHSTGLLDVGAVLDVTAIIVHGFRVGRPVSADAIAERLEAPAGVVNTIIDQLVADGLVHRLDDPERSLSMARPLEDIPLGRILDIGRRLSAMTAAPEAPSAALYGLQDGVVQGLTVADLPGLERREPEGVKSASENGR